MLDQVAGFKSLEAVERDHILTALMAFGGNRTHTAKAIKVGIRTLQRKLMKYQLSGHQVTPPKSSTK